MPIFPSSSSILSAVHLASWLNETYHFAQEAKCTLIRAGINHHYLVETVSEKYILRVYFYQWRSLNQIQEELDFILSLQQLGQAVAHPIANRNNQYLNTLNAIEGERFAVLFSFALGDYLPNPAPEICFQIGKRMANFHKVSKNQFFKYRKTYGIEALSGWALGEITQRFTKDFQPVQILQKMHQAIESAFNNIDVTTLAQGKIHLDIWYDNMRITADHKITLYDFDNCGNGWFLLDLAYTCMT
ncbi:MAG: phosphotransferase, partial [Bacteroidota bacterium]